jgi:hypothetical protein
MRKKNKKNKKINNLQTGIWRKPIVLKRLYAFPNEKEAFTVIVE